MKSQKDTIDPNKLKIREPLIQKLLAGATKAGVHVDRKKRAKKRRCRKKVTPDSED